MRPADTTTVIEIFSFGFHPIHPPLQLLYYLLSYSDHLPARQLDPAARDLNLASEGRPTLADDHCRLILRLRLTGAHSRAAHTHKLQGWGSGSSHLPPFPEISSEICITCQTQQIATESVLRERERHTLCRPHGHPTGPWACCPSAWQGFRSPRATMHVGDVTSRVPPAVGGVQNGSDGHV